MPQFGWRVIASWLRRLAAFSSGSSTCASHSRLPVSKSMPKSVRALRINTTSLTAKGCRLGSVGWSCSAEICRICRSRPSIAGSSAPGTCHNVFNSGWLPSTRAFRAALPSSMTQRSGSPASFDGSEPTICASQSSALTFSSNSGTFLPPSTIVDCPVRSFSLMSTSWALSGMPACIHATAAESDSVGSKRSLPCAASCSRCSVSTAASGRVRLRWSSPNKNVAS